MNNQNRKPTDQPDRYDRYDVVLTADGYRVAVILPACWTAREGQAWLKSNPWAREVVS